MPKVEVWLSVGWRWMGKKKVKIQDFAGFWRLQSSPRGIQIKEFRGFVYTRAAAAANFIYISIGIPSEVHGHKKKFRARALCTRRTKFMNFALKMTQKRSFLRRRRFKS
jgi:hypothetical protein